MGRGHDRSPAQAPFSAAAVGTAAGAGGWPRVVAPPATGTDPGGCTLELAERAPRPLGVRGVWSGFSYPEVRGAGIMTEVEFEQVTSDPTARTTHHREMVTTYFNRVTDTY